MTENTPQQAETARDRRRQRVYQAALDWHAIGGSTVPIKHDGSKAPSVKWNQYQESQPDLDHIETWFGAFTCDGLGLVTGVADLELMEFETHRIFRRFCASARRNGLRRLIARLKEGYIARSPGGGVHVIFQCPNVGSNTVLAGTPEDYQRPDGKFTRVKIETRGKGGFAVLAPSGGKVCPGRRYRYVSRSHRPGDGPYGAGGLSVAEITAEEREELYRLARTFDKRPPPEPRTPRATGDVSGRPGDDYNTCVEWSEILEPVGWERVVARADGVSEWRRPGKADAGISATTNWAGSDLLYVFSTSAAPFEADRSYDKFGAYAVLNHEGDHAAAAQALRAEGYGDEEAEEEREVQRKLRDLRIQDRARSAFAEERAAAQLAEQPNSIYDGEQFLTSSVNLTADWGVGKQVLMAQGEGTLVVGPQGVGKSTVAQQIAFRRIGVTEEDLFGFPVAVDDRPLLYLAMDRPMQISRSMRRMVDVDDPDVLALIRKRLIVWKGPLPFNPADAPEQFADWIARVGCDPGFVIADSYKDLASGVSEDAVGAGLNSAMQRVLDRGTGWLGLHHQRKANAQNPKPNKLEDVYGSTWLTAGVGSVLSLWGQAGAVTVELSHLKQPMEPVGPLTVNHGHAEGVSVSTEPRERLCEVVRVAGAEGITEPDAAEALYASQETNDRKRARRLLDRLTGEGLLEFAEGSKGGRGGGGSAARWRWAA